MIKLQLTDETGHLLGSYIHGNKIHNNKTLTCKRMLRIACSNQYRGFSSSRKYVLPCLFCPFCSCFSLIRISFFVIVIDRCLISFGILINDVTLFCDNKLFFFQTKLNQFAPSHVKALISHCFIYPWWHSNFVIHDTSCLT